jgi:hypothetical protein
MNIEKLGLPVFQPAPDIQPEVLRSETITKVVCCALGPLGNNIEQASVLWLKNMGVENKGEVVLGETPEVCLATARSITEEGVVSVFWTCAVYYDENKFFFGNPDVFPFFFQQVMPLDEMQLATTPALATVLMDRSNIPAGWTIASHPSPAPLVDKLDCQVILHNSNAASAVACSKCEVDLCITTESARQKYGLVKLHSFGSPIMVFFGGITRHGLEQLKKASISL